MNLAAVAVEIVKRAPLPFVDVWALRNTSRALRAAFDEHYRFARDFDAEPLLFANVHAALVAPMRALLHEHDAVVAGPHVLAACCYGERWDHNEPYVFVPGVRTKRDAYVFCVKFAKRFKLRYGRDSQSGRTHHEFWSTNRDLFVIIFCEHTRDVHLCFLVEAARAHVYAANGRLRLGMKAVADTVARRMRFDTQAIMDEAEYARRLVDIFCGALIQMRAYAVHNMFVDRSHVRDLVGNARTLEVAADAELAAADSPHGQEFFHPKYVEDACRECGDGVCRERRRCGTTTSIVERDLAAYMR